MTKITLKPGTAPVDPVLRPAIEKREARDKNLQARCTSRTYDLIYQRLKDLGIDDKREAAQFIVGSVIAAIGNVERARDPLWQKFVKAIQPQAKKVFGGSYVLGDAEDILRAGQDQAVYTPAEVEAIVAQRLKASGRRG